MKKTKQPSVIDAILTRVVSLLLLYVVLAGVFVVLVLLLAFYTPAISWYVLGGSADLSFLTAAESSHMLDVQTLVHQAIRIAAVALVLLFMYNKWRGISRVVVRDALIMNAGLALLLIPFSFTFETFHNLFFPQGNWQFPLDSWLITRYPPAFFTIAAVAWIGGSALLLWNVTKQLK